MTADPKKRIGARILLIRFFLLLCLILMGARSFDIQILQGKSLREIAENSYVKTITIQGDRGLILDRHLNRLGASIEAFNITADPTQIKDPDKTAAALAGILDMHLSELKPQLARKGRFALLARRVPPARADEIKALNITGIYIRDDSKRFYPNRCLAAQVIGFTGKDDHGLEGLEYEYNTMLEGRTLKTEERRDGNRNILSTAKTCVETSKAIPWS